jgi:hypothetical protein
MFWRKRKQGAESQKTVGKYASTLISICLYDFIIHIIWFAVDVSFFYYISLYAIKNQEILCSLSKNFNIDQKIVQQTKNAHVKYQYQCF